MHDNILLDFLRNLSDFQYETLANIMIELKIWSSLELEAKLKLLQFPYPDKTIFPSRQQMNQLLYLKLYTFVNKQNTACSFIPTAYAKMGAGWEDDIAIDNCSKSLLCSLAQLMNARPLHPTHTNQKRRFYLHNQLPYPKNTGD